MKRSRALRSHTVPGIALAGLALLTGVSLPARAQTSPAANANRMVNLNYVYAASLGFGGYTVAGLNADVYTLPLSDTLADMPYPGWALKLLAPIQGGFYDFRATDTNGRRISINQQSLSLVPGIELQIPLTPRLVLKPFAQVGIAHVFGDDVGNPDAWIYLAGARSVAQWRAGAYTFSLGNGLIVAGDKTIGRGFEEHYVALQIGAEVRHPLGFALGKLVPDIGVYAADYYYPQPLQFSRFLRSPLKVSNQTEIGLSLGSAAPFHLLFLSNPRIGAGLVFGDGLQVWHVNFGFPF